MRNKNGQMSREFAAIYARELRGSNNERLKRNLEDLEFYFPIQGIYNPGEDEIQRLALLVSTLRDIADSDLHEDKLDYWPSAKLLREIECDVLVLAGQHERIKLIFPVWKAFEQVDKRIKGLRLKSHVNNLIRHACKLLSCESQLAKAATKAKAGNAQAQCSLRDMARDPQKFAELLQDDRLMTLQRSMAVPLVWWALGIGHPMARDLGLLSEFFHTVEEHRASERRAKARGRMRRHRLRKKSCRKSVTLPS